MSECTCEYRNEWVNGVRSEKTLAGDWRVPDPGCPRHGPNLPAEPVEVEMSIKEIRVRWEMGNPHVPETREALKVARDDVAYLLKRIGALEVEE